MCNVHNTHKACFRNERVDMSINQLQLVPTIIICRLTIADAGPAWPTAILPASSSGETQRLEDSRATKEWKAAEENVLRQLASLLLPVENGLNCHLPTLISAFPARASSSLRLVTTWQQFHNLPCHPRSGCCVLWAQTLYFSCDYNKTLI